MHAAKTIPLFLFFYILPQLLPKQKPVQEVFSKTGENGKKERSGRTVPLAVKNLVFDGLTEGKGAAKTRKPDSSAYMGTVESGLRSKSKCLRSKLFSFLDTAIGTHLVTSEGIEKPQIIKISVLTVCGFLDTLRNGPEGPVPFIK